jgi:2-oxoisovalerate dehydrogenase E2 component (dihydrolipoyl transacylase)
MAETSVKLPDVGEGVAEAELVEWRVKPGDVVQEDDILAAVMTDKATVEIPAPHAGRVVWTNGEIGQTLAVGSVLVRLDDGAAPPAEPTAQPAGPTEPPASVERAQAPVAPAAAARPARSDPLRPQDRPAPSAVPAAAGARPLAAPSVRQAARERGIDLRRVSGSGPGGRILHADIDAFASGASAPVAGRLLARSGVTEVKVVGLRRKIAEKMALSKSRIPHITIVEEVDVTAVEDLREKLNRAPRDGVRLTLLPFLMRAMVRALEEQPALNALFDDDAGLIRQHAAINIGIATQTPGGLVVPVVRNAEARDLWGCAGELDRLARRARDGSASRDELGGSTITITSLGALGAIATTPVINYPEVAIVGVNRMAIRPMWNGTAFEPRKMMNLSSSFDHRVIDGYDAAVFVQRLKTLLETPAMIFVEPLR